MIELRTLYMVREKSTFKLLQDWYLEVPDEYLNDSSLYVDKKVQRKATCDECGELLQDWTDRFFTRCCLADMPGGSIFRKSSAGPLEQNDYCKKCLCEEQKKGPWQSTPYTIPGRR